MTHSPSRKANCGSGASPTTRRSSLALRNVPSVEEDVQQCPHVWRLIGLVVGLRHRGAPTVELGTELDWFLCQQADGTRSSRDVHTLSVTLATAIAARGTIEKDQAGPVGACGIILANS